MKIFEKVSKKLPFSCFVFFKVLTAEFRDCKIKEITDKKKMHRMEKHFNNVDDYVTAISWSGF